MCRRRSVVRILKGTIGDAIYASAAQPATFDLPEQCIAASRHADLIWSRRFVVCWSGRSSAIGAVQQLWTSIAHVHVHGKQMYPAAESCKGHHV